MLENKRLIKNEMKLLCTGLLLLLMLNVTVGDVDSRYTALNFGNNHTNYILFKPDMEPLRNEFTLCSWIKSFLDDDEVHTWISYAINESSGYYNEFMIGDAGNSYIFDTQLSPSLRPHFTELRGNKTWFHYCTSWSFSSKTQKFYLNGKKIGETTTPEDRRLGVGGYLAIGSDQDSYGGGFHWDNRFGGELYKLNFFSKELNASEIMEMSRSMCGGIEESYGELTHIKWEEIVELREDRNGIVTDIATGCGKDPSRLWDQLNQIKEEKAVQETELQEKEQRLNTVIQELEQSIKNSSRLTTELEKDPRYIALNFGNNHNNYILFKPDMEPLRNEFSVCSWIKSFLESHVYFHVWVSYALNESSSGYSNEIAIGDGGSYLFDIELSTSLRPYFTQLAGNKTWFHYCTSWSFSSRTQKFYLNGNKIGETTTPEDRRLGVGGYLAIGSDQDSYGGGFQWGNRFGGELYKLNFFSKELNSSEIMEMSRSVCGKIEETYGEVRHIKWEDIVELREERSGNVTDIDSGCDKDPNNKIWDLLRLNSQKLRKTEKELKEANKLNETTEELDLVRKEFKAVQQADLIEKVKQLNKTNRKLEQSKENANRLTIELEETKERLLKESGKLH